MEKTIDQAQDCPVAVAVAQRHGSVTMIDGLVAQPSRVGTPPRVITRSAAPTPSPLWNVVSGTTANGGGDGNGLGGLKGP
jgi:hypothetical protein